MSTKSPWANEHVRASMDRQWERQKDFVYNFAESLNGSIATAGIVSAMSVLIASSAVLYSVKIEGEVKDIMFVSALCALISIVIQFCAVSAATSRFFQFAREMEVFLGIQPKSKRSYVICLFYDRRHKRLINTWNKFSKTLKLYNYLQLIAWMILLTPIGSGLFMYSIGKI